MNGLNGRVERPEYDLLGVRAEDGCACNQQC